MREQYAKDCQQAEADFPREMPRMNQLRHHLACEQQGCQWRGEYAYKLLELRQWCWENQPRTILELGAGYTTCVLSAYAMEFGARLVTVEENEEWLKKVAAWIPEWERKECFVSPSMRDGDGVRYQELPDIGPIDLLYVDGPAVHGPPKACVDAVRLVERGVVVKNLLFDMRHVSVDEFRLVKGYGFEPGGTYEWKCAEYLRPRRHHSWFWRKT